MKTDARIKVSGVEGFWQGLRSSADSVKTQAAATNRCTRPAAAAIHDCSLLAMLVYGGTILAHPQAGKLGRWLAP